ncbi:hypothetical protein AOPFMNJM_0391 [Methylobacterium jeotgali]|uniref:Uncharacterized protein n=1 Tax=Methylobacterium jeotgali TaxID=381630 RepID=A0ABQ4STI5_9HYPH|nr:hypothetical protein AOPFMNJM_0391 [Methylobacterium jeotgali]
MVRPGDVAGVQPLGLEGAAGGEGRRGAGIGQAVLAAAPGAPGIHPVGERVAAAHRELRQGAERDDAEAGLVLALVPRRAAGGRVRGMARGEVELVLLVVEARADAAGAGEAEHRDAGIDEADQRRRGPRDRPDDGAGGRHQRIAGHASEAGGQRPAGGRRQGTRHGARRAEADDPERDAQAAVRQVTLAHQAQAPERWRQGEGERAEPEHLHGEIGDDRAGKPEHVVGGVVGGVVEARVLDRPGGERHRQRHGAGEEDEPAELRQPPRQERTQRVDDGVVGRCGAAKRAHAGPAAMGRAKGTRQGDSCSLEARADPLTAV